MLNCLKKKLFAEIPDKFLKKRIVDSTRNIFHLQMILIGRGVVISFLSTILLERYFVLIF